MFLSICLCAREVDKYCWDLCSINSIPRIVPQARQRQCQVFLNKIYWELLAITDMIADMFEIPSHWSSNLHKRTIAFHNHKAMQCIMSTLSITLWTKRQFFAPMQRPSRWTPLEPVALMFDSTANASTVPPPAPFTPFHRQIGRMILFGATRCCGKTQ